MEEVTQAPFYLDWSFWAVVAAAIAIILSQIPPIHLLLKKANLAVELYSRISITHKVGNPNLTLHLIINNIGGRIVRVKGIRAKIKRDGQDVTSVPAQNYLQNPSDTTPVLFTRFSLKPKEEWAHFVNFLNFFSRTKEKKYRSAESQLKNDVIEKRKKVLDEKTIVEADEKYVTPFLEFFDEMFIWHPGEYHLSVRVETDPCNAGVERNYRFTIFESDSDGLRKYTDEYKYGAGIFFDSSQQPGVAVEIMEE